MTLCIILTSLFFYFRLTIADVENEKDVVILTDKNWNDLTSTGAWLIEFYAPWCGHCKKLAPLYGEAATKLKGKVNLGKVDCTTEKELAKKYGVKSYPTLKFFRDNVMRDYRDDRTVEALVRYGNSMIRPPVISATLDTLPNQVNSFPVNFLFISPITKEPHARIFEKLAREYQGRFGFYKADEESVTQRSKTKNEEYANLFQKLSQKEDDGPSVVYLASGDDPIVFNRNTKSQFLSGMNENANDANDSNEEDNSMKTETENDDVGSAWSEKELRYFIEKYSLPPVTEMAPSNFEELTQKGKLLVFGVIDPHLETSADEKNGGNVAKHPSAAARKAHQDQLNTFKEMFLNLAKKYRNLFIFATIDGEKYEKYVNQFGIEKFHMPTVFVFDYPGEQFYIPDSIMLRDGNTITTFLEGILSGAVKAKATHAWYSPVYLYHKFEKWLNSFSETQLVIGTLVMMSIFVGILIMGCIYTSRIADEEIANAQQLTKAKESNTSPASSTSAASATSAASSTSSTPSTKKKPKSE